MEAQIFLLDLILVLDKPGKMLIILLSELRELAILEMRLISLPGRMLRQILLKGTFIIIR
jgi:hypothetical protein